MLKYERLKQNHLFSTIKRNTISDDAVKVLVHNLSLLSKHIADIVRDDGIKNNGIIGFTETQIDPFDFACKIIEILNFFNINFNNNENRLLSLAYRYGNNVSVLEKFEYL